MAETLAIFVLCLLAVGFLLSAVVAAGITRDHFNAKDLRRMFLAGTASLLFFSLTAGIILDIVR